MRYIFPLLLIKIQLIYQRPCFQAAGSSRKESGIFSAAHTPPVPPSFSQAVPPDTASPVPQGLSEQTCYLCSSCKEILRTHMCARVRMHAHTRTHNFIPKRTDEGIYLEHLIFPWRHTTSGDLPSAFLPCLGSHGCCLYPQSLETLHRSLLNPESHVDPGYLVNLYYFCPPAV